MATLATTPASAPSVEEVKQSNETYRVYAKLLPDGVRIDPNSIKVGTAGKDNAFWTKMDADTEYKCFIEQTVTFFKAGTDEGIKQLVASEEERVNIWNRGAAQKQNQKLNARLTEINEDGQLAFEPTLEAFSLLDELNAESQRRNRTPGEKAMDAVKEGLRLYFPGRSEADYHQMYLNFIKMQPPTAATDEVSA
jgi:hypothetical protein